MEEPPLKADVLRSRLPEKLTAIESIRSRPSMYVGDVGHRGLHYMVDDLLMDSLLGRQSKSLDVVLHNDGALSIADSGCGFSMPLEVILMQIPAPGGTEVAFAVANALSARFQIEADVRGQTLAQEYLSAIIEARNLQNPG